MGSLPDSSAVREESGTETKLLDLTRIYNYYINSYTSNRPHLEALNIPLLNIEVIFCNGLLGCMGFVP